MSPSPDFYSLNPPSIIVDDNDPTIQYNGTWHTANESEILSTTFLQRMPYFSTLHVLQILSGSFSYSFTGESVSVFATPFDNSSYTCQCFLNGIQLSFNSDAAKAEFGQSRPVCQAIALPDDIIHTISVNVSVSPRQEQVTNGPLSGFSFDYMVIQPPSEVSPWDNRNQDVLLPVLDLDIIPNVTNPTLNYGIVLNSAKKIADVGHGWRFDPENGFNTTTPGSQFNLTFIGTSVWWYGYLTPQNIPLHTVFSERCATLSIDGGKTLNISDGGAISRSQSQGLLFRTPDLPYASHLLTIVYHGSAQAPALTLQSLIIQKSRSIVSSSTVGLLPSTTTSQSPTSPLSRKRGKPGGVVSGIAGSVIFLLLVASGVFVLIRRAKRGQNPTQTRKNGSTVAPHPFPVSTREAVGVLAPQKAQLNQQNTDNPFMQQELQAPPLTKWTRRHTISGVPALIHSSAIGTRQSHDHADPQITEPFTHSESVTHPTNADNVDRQSHNALHLTVPMANVIVSATLSTTQVEREEDSGLRMAEPALPPVYTTH